MSIINLHIYPSPFKFETRILKETKSIISQNLATQIIILCTWEKKLPAEENISSQIRVHRVKVASRYLPATKFFKAIMYLEFYLRAMLFGLSLKVDVINCHSLMVLPIAVLLRKVKKARLIYDPHELETERLGLSGLGQSLSKWIERKLIYSSDAIIVVSDSIQEWYESNYNLKNVFTIKNTPNFIQSIKTDILRKTFSIPEDHFIFIYQGLIVEGRNIELYINAFAKAAKHMHLVVMGYGPMEDEVKKISKRNTNIHFHPAVKPHEILDYTCSADVGLCLIENCCLSYFYSLPNKFFEYIMAEVPIVASNFPDMGQIVKRFEIGWAIDLKEEVLVDLIQSITKNHLTEMKKNLNNAKSLFRWENEEVILKKVFKKIESN